MNRIRWKNTVLLGIATALSLVACRSDKNVAADDNASTVVSEQEENTASEYTSTADNPNLDGASPGKPGAPVTIRYRISDEPIIGHPLDIELQFLTAATNPKIHVQYRILDGATLVMPDKQVRALQLSIDRKSEIGAHTVTVIPQVEGRSYLIVTATVETAEGNMTKQTSIPIQVGTGGPKLEDNGELLPAADDTTVISVPAKED